MDIYEELEGGEGGERGGGEGPLPKKKEGKKREKHLKLHTRSWRAEKEEEKEAAVRTRRFQSRRAQRYTRVFARESPQQRRQPCQSEVRRKEKRGEKTVR